MLIAKTLQKRQTKVCTPDFLIFTYDLKLDTTGFFADLWEKLHTGSFFGSSRICGENMMNYRNTGVAKCYNKLVFK